MKPREIKFRAWDKKDKKFITDFTIAGDGYCARFSNISADIREGNDLIPMQYTGLKDKNSKEIYEGDICKPQYRSGVHIVEWDTNRCCFNIGNYALWEVIGNIWESKHLLDNTETKV